MLTFNELIASIGLFFTPVLPLIMGSRRAEKMVMEKASESMNMKNAVSMTVIGSIVLLGLYLFIKFISADYVQYVLLCYFIFVGSVGVSELFDFVFEKFASKEKFVLFTVPVINYKLETSKAEILGMTVGAVISIAWAITRHWMLNNFLAMCLTIVAVGELTAPSVKIGGVMLIGLFLYDIFWVFGSEVMITVATNIDGPIKFIFPKDGHLFFPEKVSLLGLGDIAIPGIYIALMKRVDTAFNNGSKYFNVTMIGYFVGLLATFVVMHVFSHGQPALLYLVPALLISAAVYSISRGEFMKLWNYHDPVDETEEESSEEESSEEEGNEENKDKDD